jgi:hypothetical protein
MADRMLLVTWGATVPGREERALEVFNEAVGLAGRMQQDGRIENFSICLNQPTPGFEGFIQMNGSAAQIAGLSDDEEFQRNTADAALIVQDLRHIQGHTGEGVARMMDIYREAIAKVPQTA